MSDKKQETNKFREIRELTGSDIVMIHNILYNATVNDPKLAYWFYKVLSAIKDDVEALKKSKETLLETYNGKLLPDGRIMFSDGKQGLNDKLDFEKAEKKLQNDLYPVIIKVPIELFKMSKVYKYFDNVGALFKLSVLLVDDLEDADI